MKTTFTMTEKQTVTVAVIGTLIILSIVLFALVTGDVSGFNHTYFNVQ